MLSLSELPPGEYRVRLKSVSRLRGEIRLLVGPSGGPLAAWHLSTPGAPFIFRIPITASSLRVVGDAEAEGSIGSVALIPVRHITTPWASTTRARAAARYGDAVVYAIDNRIIVEPDGFWVLGGRQPDVVIITDRSTTGLTLQVANVAIQNRVRVSTSTWSATRELAPDERWLVTVPWSDSAQPPTLNVRVEQGVMVGGRFLGCHISIQ